MIKDVSKIMTWHVWKMTNLHRNVTIVCGAFYHLLGSWISWDSKIRFRLQIKSYISNWWFSESQLLARYVSATMPWPMTRPQKMRKAKNEYFFTLLRKLLAIPSCEHPPTMASADYRSGTPSLYTMPSLTETKANGLGWWLYALVPGGGHQGGRGMMVAAMVEKCV